MKNLKVKNENRGFTLIELLIVIAIIGILSAVVLLVMDPAAQRTKANQAVLRSNMDKICLAFGACKATSMSATPYTECNTATLIGITTPTVPATATYLPNAGTSTWDGTLGSCIFSCDPTTNAVTKSGTCLIN